MTPEERLIDAIRMVRLALRHDDGDSDAFLDLRTALKSSDGVTLLLYGRMVATAKATGAPWSYLADLEQAVAADLPRFASPTEHR